MQGYDERLMLLLTKWRYGMISPQEMAEFNNWYLSLTGKNLVMLDGDTVDRIEELMYLQFEKNRKPMQSDEEPPPYPFT